MFPYLKINILLAYCIKLFIKCSSWSTYRCEYVCPSGKRIQFFPIGDIIAWLFICVLAMIRVGEKFLQRSGPRKPMIIACILVIAGIMLMTLTFLPN